MTRYMYPTLYGTGTEFDDETGEPLNTGGVKALVERRARPLGCRALPVQGHQGALLRPCDAAGERPLPVGTLIRNLPLADTMTKVRDGGAAAFYDPNGPVAASILQRFQEDRNRPDGSTNCTSTLPATYNANGTTSAPIIPPRIPRLMAAGGFANYGTLERKPLTASTSG